MDNITIFFIVHHNDSDVAIYKINIIDKDKFLMIVNKYSEICSDNSYDRKDILNYTTGMVNLFLGSKNESHEELIKEHLIIDLSNEIASLETLTKKNDINSIYPSRIYYIDFNSC